MKGATRMKGTLDMQDALVRVREAVDEYVSSMKPNVTYKGAPDVKEYMALPIVKAFVHALTGQRYYFVGSAGIGKTSFIKKLGDALGYDVIVIPAANLSIENLQVPFPQWSEEMSMQVLKPLIYKRFASDLPKIIFIDEIGRADDGLANTLMELLQEGTLCGLEIPNLVTVVAADNPQGKSYGKMAGLDFSQADRFATVELDSKGTPWRRALAEEFAEIDLSKVFSTYDTLGAEVREVLNPRVLAFVIRALSEGLPGHFALPIVSGVRQQLVTSTGENVTSKTLDKVAAALGAVNRENIPDVLDRVVDFSLTHKQNVYIQGAPGIGKTSRIKALLQAKAVTYHYDSAAVLSPEDMNCPFPAADGLTLDLVPTAKFATAEPWVWIVDEICRGGRRTQNAIMEPIQERTIGGNPTNIMCTIALNNPREVAGFKLDVGKNDLAQASRFALSIEIDATDIPSPAYLRDKFGEEVATPFIEWWEEDIDDVGRVMCTPRGIERLIGLYEAGNPLEWGLPYVNGGHVKVPLVDLHARLDKRPLARLKAIVADVDGYAEELAKGKDESPMEHATVFMAFYKAGTDQLEAVRDVCVRLYNLLDRQHRIDLIRQGGERQTFWNSVLLEGNNSGSR